MNIFWANGPLFIRELVELIPDPKPHYNTVATLVKFLEEKGFLERERVANLFRYHVAISELNIAEAAAESNLISLKIPEDINVEEETKSKKKIAAAEA